MQATQIKDYYKILELSPVASEHEIKKAFRRMAIRYHPDKNLGNDFAGMYFREVQEAYLVLADPRRKKMYDNERWLAGMSLRNDEEKAVSPEWILKECISLNRHMANVDVYRMSHQALHDYILQLLNEHHMAILKTHGHDGVNTNIVVMILGATRGLKYSYMQPVAERLQQLAGTDNALQYKIEAAIKERRQQARWEQAKPYFVVLVTGILVAAMYIWGIRK